MAFDPLDNVAYIVHANSNNVSEINSENNHVIDNITAGNDPNGITIDPDKNIIYVANRLDGSVSVIDTDDRTNKTISVGKWPIGLGLIPRTNTLYVANSGDNTVSVIDTRYNSVTKNITVGKVPNGIAVDPIKNRVYVANGDNSNVTDYSDQRYGKPVEQSYSNTITVIDGGSNNKTKDIIVGSGGFPKDIVLDAQRNKIYVANENSSTVSEIDSNSDEVVRTINLPFRPNDIEMDPDKGILYVSTTEVEGLIALIRVGAPGDNIIKSWLNRASPLDVVDDDFNLLQVDTRPTRFAIDNETNRGYVSNYNFNTVSVIDTKNDTIIGHIPVRDGPNGIAVDPEEKRVYVANEKNNTVSVIDTSTIDPRDNIVIDNISVGRSPTSVTLNPEDNTLYVTNGGNNTVSVVNTESNKVTKVIDVGEVPNGIAVDPEKNRVYVANSNESIVSVIDTGKNIVTKNITVGRAPTSVDINSENIVFVANSGEDTVSLIDPNYGDATIKVPVGISPTSIAIDRDKNTIYVVDRLRDIISIIKINDINELKNEFKAALTARQAGQGLSQNQILGLISEDQEQGNIEHALSVPIPKGSEPLGIYFDTNNAKLYVANGNGNTILIKNVQQQKLEEEKIASMS